MSSRRPAPVEPSSRERSRRMRWLLALGPAVLAVLALLAFWSSAPFDEDAGAVDAEAQASAGATPPRGAPAGRQGAPPAGAVRTAGEDPRSASSPEEVRRRERKLWALRLERAQLTLDRYREATRYPHESRPISEHPDQVYPSQPEREQPLDKEDPASDVKLRLKQTHVFLAGEQAVDFSVRCESAQGEPRPCEVVSAVVREAEHVPGARDLPAVPVSFADAGGPGDAQAGDGTLSARLQPSRDGFALYEGTLRVELVVQSGATRGPAFFDVVYTGAPPAAFTGAVREAVESGSLVLRLPVQVRKPGRYVVAGRVDDAQGQPFAYLSFNEELKAGRQEVVLTVFGKLLHDGQPAFPLRLRDVEGFLLREQGDPDRELLTPLQGPVHTTRSYPLSSFSPSEWTSEERERYLTEYGKDVKKAREHLDALDGPP